MNEVFQLARGSSVFFNLVHIQRYTQHDWSMHLQLMTEECALGGFYVPPLTL